MVLRSAKLPLYFYNANISPCFSLYVAKNVHNSVSYVFHFFGSAVVRFFGSVVILAIKKEPRLHFAIPALVFSQLSTLNPKL